MKIIYATFKLVLAIAMMVLGILLLFFQLDDVYREVHGFYQQTLERLSEDARLLVRPIVAGAVAIAGLILFISMLSGRKKVRSISFTGMHGPVTIELEHVESMLEKVASKLPEVRKASIKLGPTDSPGRASVIADVELLKNADEDARMVTARVQHYIQIHTKRILGLNDVDVRLNVKKFVMKMRTLKPEPLLLEGPANVVEMTAMGADTAATEDDEEFEAETEEQAAEVAVGDSGDEVRLDR
ncbi:MAG: hypothetical protein QGD90_13145 [Candidatus Hydrogenedentes bacterium]|nr:hypothetical protein [Candidatus Hydrogenedentota bacterium]